MFELLDSGDNISARSSRGPYVKGIVDILHAAGLAGGSAEALDVVDDGLAVVGFRVDEGDEVGQ